MEATTATEASLTRIESLLRAMLLLELRPHLDEKKRPSIEAALYRAGFSNTEIVEMTGIPQATVSRHLKEEGLRD